MDGQALVRIGVRRVLGDEYDVEEAVTLRDALDATTATGGFDVAVVELDGRDRNNGDAVGPAKIRAVRKAMSGAGIVALARRPDAQAAAEALEAGATAFVAKSSPPDALRAAVAAAAESDRFVDPAAVSATRPLTRRQREILQLLADGVSTAGIAHRLGLSAETVRTHTKATLARLGARDRAHAVAIGMRSALID